MKKTSSLFLALGIILTTGFAGFVRNAAALSETSLAVAVRVYNHVEADPKTLTEAEKVATEIMRKAGVETRWLNPDLGSLHQQQSSPEATSVTLPILNVHIVSRATAELFGLPVYSLGVSPGTGRNRQHGYVFYDRVEVLAKKQLMAWVVRSVPFYATRDQILGHAMAHEMGHLLGLDSHSATGIMRGDWGLDDLANARIGRLLFTRQQAEVIRSEARNRQ